MTTEPCQKNKMPQLCNAETDAEKTYKDELFSVLLRDLRVLCG